MNNQKPYFTTALALLLSISFISAVGAPARWRTATSSELRKLIPARAPVVKENIETEFRTANGVTDGSGKYIAGVVMITAGYSAEGKYSHFFITQVPLQFGDISLQPGEYVFGYQRNNNDSIRVSFYRASSGDAVGDVEAHRPQAGQQRQRDEKRGAVENELLWNEVAVELEYFVRERDKHHCDDADRKYDRRDARRC